MTYVFTISLKKTVLETLHNIALSLVHSLFPFYFITFSFLMLHNFDKV